MARRVRARVSVRARRPDRKQRRAFDDVRRRAETVARRTFRLVQRELGGPMPHFTFYEDAEDFPADKPVGAQMWVTQTEDDRGMVHVTPGSTDQLGSDKPKQVKDGQTSLIHEFVHLRQPEALWTDPAKRAGFEKAAQSKSKRLGRKYLGPENG